MDKLKSKGLIKHIGPDKGGYWKIINQGNRTVMKYNSG